MAARKGLVDALFEEMKGRIREDDKSVPQKDGAFLYWSSFEVGEQYRRHWRRPVGAPDDGSADELILDEPALAAGKDYFRVGAVSISNDDRLLAFAIDDNGAERFTVRIKDLATGELLPDVIPDVLSALVWTSDDKALVYAPANEQWRTDCAKLHRLGTDVSGDVELFHEDDEGFRVSVGMTAAENWIVIATGDHVTSEVRLVPAGDPTAPAILVAPRLPDREYDVDEHEGWLYIRTNDTHTNFRLVRSRIETPDRWEEVLPASDSFYLIDVSLFKSFYVTEGRENGLDQVEIRDYATNTAQRLAFPEASYSAGLDDNPEYDTGTLRLSYESMVSPETIFDLDLATGARTVLKVQEIPSGYDPSLYATSRLLIPARDGTPIPVSIMHRADHPMDGSRPLYLYGYGAYGIAMEPSFGTGRLSLVDRGYAFAIAHIRGGDDLGQQWYIDGKLEKRTNTFNDFVDVAKGLIALGYTSAGRIATSGGSAGGELMGAIVNSDPDLWGAVVAHVPFVDVLNTHARRDAAVDAGRMAGMGQPHRGPGRLRPHRQLLPLRQCEGAGLSADAGDRRSQRSARHLLGAGQMGRAAARDQDRRQHAAPQDQHGRGPWWQVRPLGIAARDRRGIRLHPLADGRGRAGGEETLGVFDRLLFTNEQKTEKRACESPFWSPSRLAVLPLGACATDSANGRYGYNNPSDRGYSDRRDRRGREDRRARYLAENDEIYRDNDGRYYCKRSDGSTGTIAGAIAGGVLGNIIAPGGSKDARHRARRGRWRAGRQCHRQEQRPLRIAALV